MPHFEHHYSQRSPLIRAGVLGANDGIISMSGVLLAVTSSGASIDQINLTVFSALVAGALSMGAGEYISVGSQLDSEKADIEREKNALEHSPQEEFAELIENYKTKGLSDELATEVAKQLTSNDALKHHLNEELGFDQESMSSPKLAAISSFLSFVIGGGIASLIPSLVKIESISAVTYPVCIMSLAMLGIFSAKLGGSPVFKGTFRVISLGVAVLAVSQVLGKYLLG